MFIQADVERQFEFVQKEWMHGGEFMGLDPNEQDPINGVGGEDSQMTVPGAKRPFLFDLPTFVKVKGGEYLGRRSRTSPWQAQPTIRTRRASSFVTSTIGRTRLRSPRNIGRSTSRVSTRTWRSSTVSTVKRHGR
jgi:hypothetical protein